jgi:hypothetical protein
MSESRRRFGFAPKHTTLQEVLADHDLATLGDAYVNFLYSLYLSAKTSKAAGEKADGRMLADALKRAGLRKQVASRADRHQQADAAEALLVYAWLHRNVTISGCVELLLKHGSPVDAFSALLVYVSTELGL